MYLSKNSSKQIEICNKSLYQGTAIKGVLFDMDGVILDTEKLYTRFWVEAAQSLGYPMTHEMGLGMRSLSKEMGEKQLKAYLGETVDYNQVRNKRIEMMDAYLEENGVEAKEGIFELLQYLKEKGLKLAVATSSPMDRTTKYLSQIGVVQVFDALVSGHEVPRGKPEPDIYIEAAKRLGLKPEECMVIEDSPNGSLAAYRGGCVPIMVPDQDVPDEKTKEILYGVVETLEDMKTFLYRK